MRKIYCQCGKYCGEIRDAKLIKGLKFCCTECEINPKENFFERELKSNRDQQDFINGLKKFSKGFKDTY